MANTLGTAVLELTTDDSKLQAGLRSAEQETRGWLGALQTAVGTALGFGAAIMGVQAIGGMFSATKDAIIGMNASLETSTLQFQTLMGDAQKARQHVEGLFKFAAETPFETGPIIEASRLLQTFGGSALNTEANLRLVGDAAAATSNQINEVAFWVGRAYSMIQAGKPFGEAAMRLQEMGILSAEARARLEQLQESGASGAQVWAAFQEELQKFNGAMKLQAGTWQGLTSTISDNLKMLTATAFRPLFDLLKEGAAALANFLQSERVQQFAERVAEALRGVIEALRVIATGDFRVRQLFDALSQPGAATGMMALLNPLGALAREVLPALMPLFQTLVQVLAQLATTVGPPVAQLIAQIGAVLRDAIAQVLPYVVQLFQQLAPAFGQVLAALVPLISQGLQVLISAILPPLIDLLSQVLSWLANNETAVKVLAGALVALIAVMNPIPAAVASVLAAVALLKAHWEDIANFLTTVVPQAIQALMDKLASIPIVGPIIEGWLNTMKAIFEAIWNDIKVIVETVINVIRGIIQVVTSLIRGDWEGAWNGIKAIAEAIWDGIKGLIENRLDLVKNLVGSYLNMIRGIWDDIWGGIKGAAEAVWNAISSIIGEKAAAVRDTVVGAFEFMRDRAGAALGLLKMVAEGVRDAFGWMADKAGEVKDMIVGAAEWIRDRAGSALGFFKMVLDGIRDAMQWILDNVGKVTGALSKMKVPDLTPGFDIPGVPFFQRGAWEIPRTTLGVLHPGEMVLPASLAEAVRHALTRNERPGGPAQVSISITVQERDVAAEVERVLRRALFQAGW